MEIFNNATNTTVTVSLPSKDYMTLEMPPDGEVGPLYHTRLPALLHQTRCRDCIKFLSPNTCPNDLLELMKTGYGHSKPLRVETDKRGKTKDTHEVIVTIIIIIINIIILTIIVAIINIIIVIIIVVIIVNIFIALEVMVGATVDLYCNDYWKKPKKDSWDDDKKDGILTALCQPNLKFSVPYDISR